jgi:hypothetical protein
MAENVDDKPMKTETIYKVLVIKVTKSFPYRDKSYEVVNKIVDEHGDEKKDYGYVYYDDTKDVEDVIYRQELEEIDLPQIIKAVNNMEK